jgi:hypothetical protein
MMPRETNIKNGDLRRDMPFHFVGLYFGTQISQTVRGFLMEVDRIARSLDITESPVVARWFELMAHVATTVYCDLWRKQERMDFGIGLRRLLKQLSEIQQRRDAAAALDCLVCLLLFCPPGAYRHTRLNCGGHYRELLWSKGMPWK